MTDEEVWAFLDSSPARPAILATTEDDGRPHAVPVWYALDGPTLVFTTGAATVTGRARRRDPRVAMGIDDDHPPFSFVAVDGDVELSEDLPEMRRWATIIGWRHIGAGQAEAFDLRNGVPGELLVRAHPRRVTPFNDVAL